MYPVTLDDLSFGRALDIEAFFDAAAGVHRRLCDVIHQVVVHRRGVGGSLRFCLFLGLMNWIVVLPRLRIWVFGLMDCWMLILP